jgi:hypothetical protein
MARRRGRARGRRAVPRPLHEVAQREAPDCRIVYADNDPIVLTHARALLRSTPLGSLAYLDADLRYPDMILAEAVKTPRRPPHGAVGRRGLQGLGAPGQAGWQAEPGNTPRFYRLSRSRRWR